MVSTFLLRQVGEKQARDLLLTGRIISADEAFRLGLATEVVAADKLMDRVRELADTLLKNCPTSLQATKRLLRTFSGEELIGSWWRRWKRMCASARPKIFMKA